MTMSAVDDQGLSKCEYAKLKSSQLLKAETNSYDSFQGVVR